MSELQKQRGTKNQELVFELPANYARELSQELENLSLVLPSNQKEATTFLTRFLRRRNGSSTYTVPLNPETVYHLESFAKFIHDLAVRKEDSAAADREGDNPRLARKYQDLGACCREVASTILRGLQDFDGLPRLTRQSDTSAEPDFKNIPPIPEHLGKLALLYEDENLHHNCQVALSRFGFPTLAGAIKDNPLGYDRVILDPLCNGLDANGHPKLAGLMSAHPRYVTGTILEYFQQKSVGGGPPGDVDLAVKRNTTPKPSLPQIIAPLSIERLIAVAEVCGLVDVVKRLRDEVTNALLTSIGGQAKRVVLESLSRDELELVYQSLGTKTEWWDQVDLVIMLLNSEEIPSGPGMVAVSGVSILDAGEELYEKLTDLGAAWNSQLDRWEVPQDKLREALTLSPRLRAVNTSVPPT